MLVEKMYCIRKIRDKYWMRMEQKLDKLIFLLTVHWHERFFQCCSQARSLYFVVSYFQPIDSYSLHIFCFSVQPHVDSVNAISWRIVTLSLLHSLTTPRRLSERKKKLENLFHCRTWSTQINPHRTLLITEVIESLVQSLMFRESSQFCWVAQ